MNSTKKTARVAGLLFHLVAVCNGFAAFVRSSLIVSGDAAATVNNIIASEMLFRIDIVSDLIGQVFHVLLALVLYELLKTVNKNYALLMVILALVPVPIAMLNQLNQFAVLLLLRMPSRMLCKGVQETRKQDASSDGRVVRYAR